MGLSQQTALYLLRWQVPALRLVAGPTLYLLRWQVPALRLLAGPTQPPCRPQQQCRRLSRVNVITRTTMLGGVNSSRCLSCGFAYFTSHAILWLLYKLCNVLLRCSVWQVLQSLALFARATLRYNGLITSTCRNVFLRRAWAVFCAGWCAFRVDPVLLVKDFCGTDRGWR
jgi:hypothetical protein